MFYDGYHFGDAPYMVVRLVNAAFWIFATPYGIPGQRYRKDTPLDILKKRYASGQINDKEYQEKKRIIESELPIQDRL